MNAPAPAADLRSCASTLRSRNAGSFMLSVDVVFRTPELYEAWKASGLLGPAALAPRFGTDPAETVVTWFPPANAVKVTFPRRVSAGGPEDTDTDGAQSYVLLLDLRLPAPTPQ